MGRVGMEGISAMTWAMLIASASYSLPVAVASCAVQNLKIRGARACFSSPAAFISVQQRCKNTNL